MAGFTFLASLTIPRLLPFLFVLLGLLSAAALVHHRSERWSSLWRHPMVVALLLLLGYLFINASWAINGSAALQKSALVFCMGAVAVLISACIAESDEWIASGVAKGALLGFTVGLLYLIVDLATDRAIWIFIHELFPTLESVNPKNVVIKDGRIDRAGIYVLNRNVTLAVLLVWPVFLLLAGGRERWRRIARASVIAGTAVCIILSDSQTSLVALAAGLAVYTVASSWLVAARWAVLTVWVVGMVLAVPLGALPHKQGWASWPGLAHESVAARFNIWAYTADKVAERPIGGIGVRGTRELQKADGIREDAELAERFQPRPGRHAHNAFLQIWLELGAVGAALVLALGVAVLRQITRLGPHEAAVGYALFTTVCSVAAFGYGIWQTWFLAGFGLAAVTYCLGLRLRHAGLS